jgi:hypothetical protein
MSDPASSHTRMTHGHASPDRARARCPCLQARASSPDHARLGAVRPRAHDPAASII